MIDSIDEWRETGWRELGNCRVFDSNEGGVDGTNGVEETNLDGARRAGSDTY